MDILELMKTRRLFFDGGTGTLLQEKGLGPGEFPEYWNIDKKEALIAIHKDYFLAGCDVVMANTFGANGLKFPKDGDYSVQNIVRAGVENAKKAANEAEKELGRDCFVALDMGPTGKLLKPMGDLPFEDAVNYYKEVVEAGTAAGADLIVIETMSDTYELKAAVLAAKESSNLPVFATVIFEEKGKLLTGCDVAGVVALLEGLGVDALGVNCGLGPYEMLPIVKEMLSYASIPVIVNPNAGLPRSVNGRTVFDITPENFANPMKEMAEMGASVLGGCCGTTPAHMKEMIKQCGPVPLRPVVPKNRTVVSSYGGCVEIGKEPVIIGERINPTGKARFKQALKDGDIDYILGEGFAQQEKGAHILDVNVGLPDIQEEEMMERVVQELQSVLELPLQIDTASPLAMERALRIYNGKALINSVNGKEEIMSQVFPLVKKYGGVVVGLTLDEQGIPQTAQGRLAVARKIVETAAAYGIEKKDIIIDVLCMTISSDSQGAVTTLEALELVKKELGVKTILGVSNISFGLPQREILNSFFYALALERGLDAAIINPNAESMRKAYFAFCALKGLDENCVNYIDSFGGQATASQPAVQKTASRLGELIERGLREAAFEKAKEMLGELPPLEIIQRELIPALDRVGKGFEKGTVFLPQLLMSAEAAKGAFEAVKEEMSKEGTQREKIGKVILATVKGDIHDIGKNIVKVLLENYGFDVIDLGKDVDPQIIVDTAVRQQVTLIGLSALMTTTVTSMEATIQALRATLPQCKIMVGGAVLTQEYADQIGADHYGKDAMSSVYYAQKVLGQTS